MVAEKKFYITTAIPYVNAPPHMGHALEFIQTDALARYYKMKGYAVFLATGTDENSLKCVRAATDQKIEVQALCDKNSAIVKEFADRIGLSYTSFTRTSDKEAHWRGVEKLWKLCFDAGDIYKKSYKGLYCVGCEAFYAESELVNGLCPEHLKPPEVVNEENYFFRLSKYEKELKELIASDKLKIIPKVRKNEALSFIDQGLNDFSISRSTERSKGWGIPVPNDPSQTIYVWFDALSVYLSGVGFGNDEKQFRKMWPADLQVIGKGVIRFHAVYWPAMLLSAGLDVPKEILAHGYVTSDGHKMGKSLGNAVDPLEMVNKYTADAVRYYLLRNIPTFEDGDFSEKDLITNTNSELIGNIGNFVHRTLTFMYKNFDGKIESVVKSEDGLQLLGKVETAVREIDADLSEAKLGNGLSKISALSAAGNKYFQDNAPWETVSSDKEKCKETLFVCANICKSLGVLLYPYLPDASRKISEYFNIRTSSFEAAKIISQGTIQITEPQPLFRKIDEKTKLKR